LNINIQGFSKNYKLTVYGKYKKMNKNLLELNNQIDFDIPGPTNFDIVGEYNTLLNKVILKLIV